MTFKRRLAVEYNIKEDCKLYLGEVKQENYMLDPMSLNDFPRIVEMSKAKEAVKILVIGDYI